MPPNAFNQLWLISAFELKRAFTTRPGLSQLFTISLVWLIILCYPVRYASNLVIQEHGLLQALFGMLASVGFTLQADLSQIPEFTVFWPLAQLLFPLLSFSLAADQTCSDRQRGTLRFIVLRSSRTRVFFGRFLGILLLQGSLIVTACGTVVALVVYRDAALMTVAWQNSGMIALNLLLIILPFTALLACFSTLFKTPGQASLWAMLLWTFADLLVNSLADALPAFAALSWLVPGYPYADFTQTPNWQTLHLAYVPVLQSVFWLSLGHWHMQRVAL